MYSDDFLPAVYSVNPFLNIEAWARRSGLANQLRACQCVLEKCQGVAEQAFFGSDTGKASRQKQGDPEMLKDAAKRGYLCLQKKTLTHF